MQKSKMKSRSVVPSPPHSLAQKSKKKNYHDSKSHSSKHQARYTDESKYVSRSQKLEKLARKKYDLTDSSTASSTAKSNMRSDRYHDIDRKTRSERNDERMRMKVKSRYHYNEKRCIDNQRVHKNSKTLPITKNEQIIQDDWDSRNEKEVKYQVNSVGLYEYHDSDGVLEQRDIKVRRRSALDARFVKVKTTKNPRKDWVDIPKKENVRCEWNLNEDRRRNRQISSNKSLTKCSRNNVRLISSNQSDFDEVSRTKRDERKNRTMRALDNKTKTKRTSKKRSKPESNRVNPFAFLWALFTPRRQEIKKKVMTNNFEADRNISNKDKDRKKRDKTYHKSSDKNVKYAVLSSKMEMNLNGGVRNGRRDKVSTLKSREGTSRKLQKGNVESTNLKNRLREEKKKLASVTDDEQIQTNEGLPIPPPRSRKKDEKGHRHKKQYDRMKDKRANEMSLCSAKCHVPASSLSAAVLSDIRRDNKSKLSNRNEYSPARRKVKQDREKVLSVSSTTRSRSNDQSTSQYTEEKSCTDRKSAQTQQASLLSQIIAGTELKSSPTYVVEDHQTRSPSNSQSISLHTQILPGADLKCTPTQPVSLLTQIRAGTELKSTPTHITIDHQTHSNSQPASLLSQIRAGTELKKRSQQKSKNSQSDLSKSMSLLSQIKTGKQLKKIDPPPTACNEPLSLLSEIRRGTPLKHVSQLSLSENKDEGMFLSCVIIIPFTSLKLFVAMITHCEQIKIRLLVEF